MRIVHLCILQQIFFYVFSIGIVYFCILQQIYFNVFSMGIVYFRVLQKISFYMYVSPVKIFVQGVVNICILPQNSLQACLSSFVVSLILWSYSTSSSVLFNSLSTFFLHILINLLCCCCSCALRPSISFLRCLGGWLLVMAFLYATPVTKILKPCPFF